jgi:Family of unknown function (DUF6511)
MVDKTSFEDQALDAVLPALAEAVAEIGKGKPLDHYSREEIRQIVDICVSEYQNALLKILAEQPCDEEIPL